jgi:cytoskeletal protein CcmA (bactofilin family)
MWGQEKQDGKRTGDGASEEGAAPVAASSDGTEDIIAFVGKGVQFKGVISYNGTVRIDGNLDGEIHTDGVLLIGDEAVIQAKVTAGTIVCKGKITGDIAAKERVKLRAPAVFNGNMKTPILSIEDGVLFNGGLEMTQAVRDPVALHPVAMTASPAVKRASGQ